METHYLTPLFSPKSIVVFAGDAGVDMEPWALVAEAIRSEQVDAVPAGDGMQFPGQRGLDAARQDQRGAALDAAGHLQRERQVLVGQGDHGQIGARLGQVAQGAGHAGLEEGDRSREAALFELGGDVAAVTGLGIGLVDVSGEDDDRLGGKQRGQVVGFNGRRWRFSSVY